MDVLNKIINFGYEEKLTDENISEIVDFYRTLEDYNKKCIYIRTIIEGLSNKIIKPDTFTTVAIAQCETFDDILLIALGLRFGANPNMYVVMDGVGIVHIMVYTVLYNRDRIPLPMIENILAIERILGSSPNSNAVQSSDRVGRKYNIETNIPYDLRVAEFLEQEGFNNFLDINEYFDKIDIEEQIVLGAMTDNVNVAFPEGPGSAIINEVIDQDGFVIMPAREEPLPQPRLEDTILFNSYMVEKKLTLSLRYYNGENLQIRNAMESIALEIFMDLIDRGFFFTYFSMNRLLLLLKETTNGGKIVRKISNIVYLEMLKYVISKGIPLDEEQFNIIRNFSEEYVDEINELYSKPKWEKACAGSDNVPLPEFVKTLAFSMNIDISLPKSEVCDSIRQIVSDNEEEVIDAAVTRHKDKAAAELRNINDYTKGKNDVYCQNIPASDGNPFEYNDLALAYYTDKQDRTWCFIARDYDNLILNPVNPKTGEPLPRKLISKMRRSLETFEDLGIPPKEITRISESLVNIKKDDKISNERTDFIVDSIIRIGASRGIFPEFLRRTPTIKMMEILDEINMRQDYLGLLTQTHQFATFCRALYYFFKSDMNAIGDIFDKL